MACFAGLVSSYSNQNFESDSGEDTSIEHLPNEILAPIFRKIPIPHRNNLRGVSKKWKFIVDEMVGLTIRIGTYSNFDFYNDKSMRSTSASGSPKYHHPSIISNVGIESCLVGNLEDHSNENTGLLKVIRHFFLRDEPDTFPEFKNPFLVSTLKFFGWIQPQYFTTILSGLTCLRLLSVHFATLDSLGVPTVTNLNLPNLEVFEITGGVQMYHLHPRVYEHWDFINILRNILSIINGNHFPKLKEASIDLIYDFDEAAEITKSLLKFLHKHGTTIQSFSLQYCILVNEFISDEGGNPVGHPDLVEVAKDVAEIVQLPVFHVFPLCLSALPFSNAWFSLINAQKSLDDFAVVGARLSFNEVKRIINSNYLTLTSICMCRILLYDNNEIIQPFDCSIFQPCVNLKHLMLRGWTVSLRVKNLFNVECFPKSLTHIDLGDMAIGTEDIATLALEMPRLRDLELRSVGNKEEMGMDEDTLREIIARKQIQVCRLSRAFNGNLETGVYNGDEDNPDYISETPGKFIGFRLEKDGFYRRILRRDSRDHQYQFND